MPVNRVTFLFCILLMTSACWDATYLGAIQSGSNPDDSDTVTDTGTLAETDSPTIDTHESESDSSPVTATESDTESDTGTSTEAETEPDTGTGLTLPDSFQWTSSGPLISPLGDDIHIKDPTVVRYNDEWLVYATRHRANDGGLSLAYIQFSDWSEATTAEKIAVNTNGRMSDLMGAPQLFYFSPRDEWYLIYQHQEPAYSVSSDPSDIATWSAPQSFMPIPPLLTDAETLGYDYWIICDESNCYMFFSGLNDVLYRARTPISDFPNGFAGSTEIVMQANPNTYSLYDACNVYRIADTGQYLLLVSAIGPGQDDWRYFRAWTAEQLDGDWTPLADSIDNSFASRYNSTGSDWSRFGISHGEMLRWNPDETMTIQLSDMQYLYSGLKPNPDGSEQYELGLLSIVR